MKKSSIKSVTNRNNWIDAVKCIGILLVVLGHTSGCGVFISKFINSFHMPLFFVVAGYLYNKEKYNKMKFFEVLKKKFIAYIIPYFSLAFINLNITILWEIFYLKNHVGINKIINYIAGIFYCYADVEYMPNCTPIWFLMSLFFASIIFWLIMKHFKKRMRLVIVVCLTIFGYILSVFIKFILPFNIVTSLVSIIFMYIGWILKEIKIFQKLFAHRKIFDLLILALLFVIGICSSQINDIVLVSQNKYSCFVLFLISSLSLSIGTMFAIYYFRFSFLVDNSFVNYWGRNTMYVIGFNYVIRDFITEVYYMIPIIKNYQLNVVVSFVVTSLSLFLLIIIVNKIKSSRQITHPKTKTIVEEN